MKTYTQWGLVPSYSNLRSLINNISTPLFDQFCDLALNRYSPVKTELLDKQHPRINAYQKEDNLVLDLFVPYYTKDNISVEADAENRVVTIAGTAMQDNTVRDGDYYLRQISRGSFRRPIQISAEYDLDKLSAELNDGILRLTIPPIKRQEKSHKSKKINIL